MAATNQYKDGGPSYKWLATQIGYTGDDCLIWPFCRDGNGRGVVGYKGKRWLAHRLMCTIVKGPCPDGLECAHSCGNGHLGCINPMHLDWKTKSENQRDRWKHGTQASNRYGKRSNLTDAQILEIKQTAGKESCASVAKRMGCHAETVRYWRSTDKGLSKFRGATFSRGRWRARIRTGGVTTYLGSFVNEADATKAFDEAVARVRAGLPPKAA